MTVKTGDKITLIGFGSHAGVVRSIAALREQEIAGYIDQKAYDNPIARLGQGLADLSDSQIKAHKFHIAIGDNAARLAYLQALLQRNANLWSAIHPDALLAKQAQLGRGVFVGARAIVNPGAVVADASIINTGAIVEHDCHLSAGVHVAPGAVVCGGVHIGEGALIGANATVLPNIHIGRGARVGAGAVLKHNLPDGRTFA